MSQTYPSTFNLTYFVALLSKFDKLCFLVKISQESGVKDRTSTDTCNFIFRN